jgi:hypothetical protein
MILATLTVGVIMIHTYATIITLVLMIAVAAIEGVSPLLEM